MLHTQMGCYLHLLVLGLVPLVGQLVLDHPENCHCTPSTCASAAAVGTEAVNAVCPACDAQGPAWTAAGACDWAEP